MGCGGFNRSSHSRSLARERFKRNSFVPAADGELPGASAAAGGGKARLNRAEEIGLNAHQTRHARRFYISGFPPDVDEAGITKFFNDAFNTVLVARL